MADREGREGKGRVVDVSVVSGNAPESIAELQAELGNHVTKNGVSKASRFLYAFTHTNYPSSGHMEFCLL
jgi:hypothetical protein